jgi:hypothetical protein
MRFTGQPIRNRRLPHANAGSDLASRGVESPDRADALIGAIMLGIGSDPYALNPGARQAMHEMMDQTIRRMERNRSPFAAEHVNLDFLR